MTDESFVILESNTFILHVNYEDLLLFPPFHIMKNGIYFFKSFLNERFEDATGRYVFWCFIDLTVTQFIRKVICSLINDENIN